jgi:hypothetical protein
MALLCQIVTIIIPRERKEEMWRVKKIQKGN